MMRPLGFYIEICYSWAKYSFFKYLDSLGYMTAAEELTLFPTALLHGHVSPYPKTLYRLFKLSKGFLARVCLLSGFDCEEASCEISRTALLSMCFWA